MSKSVRVLVQVAGLGLWLLGGGCDDDLKPLSDAAVDATVGGDGAARDSTLRDGTGDHGTQADGADGAADGADAGSALDRARIVFVIDCSGSMEFTDPSTATQAACLADCQASGAANCQQLCSGSGAIPGRQAAVRAFVDAQGGDSAYQYGIVRFNALPLVNGGVTGCDRFVASGSCLDEGIASLAEAELFTDYHSALVAAHDLLQAEMAAASAGERARTKYAVVLLSDGLPDPLCHSGCDNDPLTVPSGASWCDAPRSQWCEDFYLTGDKCLQIESFFPAMTSPCADFNQPSQLVQLVDEIVDLGAQQGVGEIRVHTALLFDPSLPQAIVDMFDPDPDHADSLETRIEQLLKDLARTGAGIYRNYVSAQQIDFTHFRLGLP